MSSSSITLYTKFEGNQFNNFQNALHWNIFFFIFVFFFFFAQITMYLICLRINNLWYIFWLQSHLIHESTIWHYLITVIMISKKWNKFEEIHMVVHKNFNDLFTCLPDQNITTLKLCAVIHLPLKQSTLNGLSIRAKLMISC